MTAARKPRRAREAEPERRHPTERQMDAALAAFDKAKLRHRLIQAGDTFIVQILPDMLVEISNKPIGPDATADHRRFHDEPSARQWREREIIKEAVTAALRAKP